MRYTITKIVAGFIIGTVIYRLLIMQFFPEWTQHAVGIICILALAVYIDRKRQRRQALQGSEH